MGERGAYGPGERVALRAGAADEGESARVQSDSGGGVTLLLEGVRVAVSAREAAACVAHMDSGAQAAFLAELARLFSMFDGALGPDGQALMVGADLGASPGGADAVELLRTVLEAAEEQLVKGVMES